MKKRRLLSIVISLCMVLALMPQMVFADGPTGTPLTKDNVTDGLLWLDNGKSYYLSEDIDITSPIIINGSVTLDLNGYKISMTSKDSVIKVGNNGELTLQDNSEGKTGMITGGHTLSSGGGVFVSSGSFVMEGGKIYDCSASSRGGGVFVTGGSFTMKGGKIYDCYAGEGGSVATDGGIFTMEGGIIDSGNELVSNDIIVYANSTFNANGGVVKSFVNSNGQINNTASYGGTIFYGDSNRFGNIIEKKVIFEKDNSTYATEIVKNGEKAIEPTAPTKYGYKFTGWYTDEELTRLYDFDTPVKDNELILYAGWKVTVPLITTIKQDGNVAPGEATFNLQIVNRKGNKITSEDVKIKGTSVTTNGKGSYEGEITFTGTQREILELFDNNSGTVFVKQEDVDDSDWDVDDTVWCLYYPRTGALSEDEAEPSPVLILPTICEYDGDDMYYNPDFPDDNENPLSKMTFTNTYTKSEASPTDPEGTTNGDSDNDSKAGAEDSAKTGDNTNLALWLALMLLSGAGIIGVTAYTRRKRTNE